MAHTMLWFFISVNFASIFQVYFTGIWIIMWSQVKQPCGIIHKNYDDLHGLVQERRNSIANTLELPVHLSCTKPSNWLCSRNATKTCAYLMYCISWINLIVSMSPAANRFVFTPQLCMTVTDLLDEVSYQWFSARLQQWRYCSFPLSQQYTCTYKGQSSVKPILLNSIVLRRICQKFVGAIFKVLFL